MKTPAYRALPSKTCGQPCGLRFGAYLAAGCALYHATAATSLRFDVTVEKSLAAVPVDGRVFVVLSRTNEPEPRLSLGENGPDAPVALARDVQAFGNKSRVTLDRTAFSYPITNLAGLEPGDYFVQAILDSNRDLRSSKAPGNLFSLARKVHLDPGHGAGIKLELSKLVPPEQLPPETDQVRFVKLESKLLSAFYGRPIFLRAGIVLPLNYAKETDRRYPLWVRIGGFDTRYSIVNRQMSGNSGFKNTWLAEDTPRFILLQLDGAGPLGDPYYVNSANCGPYGDALVQELIPYVEEHFRGVGSGKARVLSGVSTGGWVSLALQVFYPDCFNGAWSSCPDPVDFRAFELVNLYEDENAYVNRRGHERPSERDLGGDVALTMRREVGVENLLGPGNSYTRSGGQWGAWNAVFGARGADGLPVPIWGPISGKINRAGIEQWKKYDLRLVLEKDWKTLGPKLRGKLHIASGEADQYFLNNAVHLLDEFLAHTDPPAEARIAYGSRKGHGWSNLSLREMLEEMAAAVGQNKGSGP